MGCKSIICTIARSELLNQGLFIFQSWVHRTYEMRSISLKSKTSVEVIPTKLSNGKILALSNRTGCEAKGWYLWPGELLKVISILDRTTTH